MSSSPDSTSFHVDDALLARLRAVKEQSAMVRHCPKTDTDITIAFQTHGDPANPCILLVMGLNGQLTLWDLEFVEKLVAKGFYVVRYDNRDVGLSTKLDKCGSPGLLKLLFPTVCGCCGSVPYLLVDMAADAMALLTHLKIEKAHVVGISMGGMLAQTMAIEFPHRVLSLASIASNTGSPKAVDPNMSMKLFLAKKPKSNSPHDLATYRVMFERRTGGPKPFQENLSYTRGIYSANRCNYMEGAMRHAGAIVFSGSRVEGLKRVAERKLPCLVVHGDRDELVPTANGYQTYEALGGAANPHCRFVLVPEMGHIIFDEHFDFFADEIARHCSSS